MNHENLPPAPPFSNSHEVADSSASSPIPENLGTFVDGFLVPTGSFRTKGGIELPNLSGPANPFFITPQQGASADGYWAPSGARRQAFSAGAKALAPVDNPAYLALLEGHAECLGDDMVRQIGNYTPQSVAPADWASIEWYVKELVASTADLNLKDPIAHVSAVVHYVHYWHNLHGQPLDSASLWTAPLIVAYTERTMRDRPDRYIATNRSRLLGVAAKVNPRVVVSMPKRGRSKVGNAPYEPWEIERFKFVASSLDTVYKRRSVMLTLALSTGAGLNPADYVNLKNEHVIKDPHGPGSGFDIEVPDGWGQSRTSLNARRVPLLPEWEPLMYELWDGDVDPAEFVTWPNIHENRTSLAALGNGVRRAIKQVEQRPKVHRLRTTWVIHHLRQGTPIHVLRDAAGLNSAESLYRYMDFIEKPDWETARRILRGTEWNPWGNQ